MKIVYSEKHAQHDPQHFVVRGTKQRSAEQPERATRLLAAATAAGHTIVPPGSYGPAPATTVHTPDYLDFLQIAAREWAKLPGASPEVVPNVHPARAHASYPKALAGRAGWHQVDTGCPIGPHTWDAALAATEVAATVADMVLAGEHHVYALCRPSGHHVYADMAGGFCFLNNTAVAAQRLRSKHERVAILDVDVHHGNGTQGIFYARQDVFFASIHRDPIDYHPFFCGHAHERGAGAGLGCNLNLPLPAQSKDDVVLAALETACARIAAHGATALVVSLGVDGHEDDPTQGLAITHGGFRRIGARLAALGLPSVIVQEGGYNIDTIARCVSEALAGFEGREQSA